jgi:hypothetical protein
MSRNCCQHFRCECLEVPAVILSRVKFLFMRKRGQNTKCTSDFISFLLLKLVLGFATFGPVQCPWALTSFQSVQHVLFPLYRGSSSHRGRSCRVYSSVVHEVGCRCCQSHLRAWVAFTTIPHKRLTQFHYTADCNCRPRHKHLLNVPTYVYRN